MIEYSSVSTSKFLLISFYLNEMNFLKKVSGPQVFPIWWGIYSPCLSGDTDFIESWNWKGSWNFNSTSICFIVEEIDSEKASDWPKVTQRIEQLGLEPYDSYSFIVFLENQDAALVLLSIHGLLYSPNSSNFGFSIYIWKISSYTFPREYCSSFWHHPAFQPPFVLILALRLRLYLPFLVILHFPAESFSAFLCSQLQEADLYSLCHLTSFILWLLVRASR